jgi:hypothetical protein
MSAYILYNAVTVNRVCHCIYFKFIVDISTMNSFFFLLNFSVMYNFSLPVFRNMLWFQTYKLYFMQNLWTYLSSMNIPNFIFIYLKAINIKDFCFVRDLTSQREVHVSFTSRQNNLQFTVYSAILLRNCNQARSIKCYDCKYFLLTNTSSKVKIKFLSGPE